MTQEHSEIDIKQVIQQMKHLQYENQTRIGEMRAENMTQLKLAQEDHCLQEQELLKDKRELRRLLREKEESTELQIQQLKMAQSERLSQERARFEKEATEMMNLHKKRLDHYIEESEIKHRMEMSEVEERKHLQVSRLIQEHERAFGEMKNYYNDITLNNLALISSLKEQMEDLRHQSERNERIVAEVTQENKKLVEPLKEARVELVELRKKLENYQRDKKALSRTSGRYDNVKKTMNDMRWETEALKMRCENLTEERDQLKNKFEEAILELQQKTGLKNVLLERKLLNLQKDTEKREAILGEVLTVAGMEPQNLSVRIEKLLQNKNEKIQDLRYELARVCKAHDDLLETYEAKMVQFGIPKEELGFQPYRSSTPMKLGTGPAGLVARK